MSNTTKSQPLDQLKHYIKTKGLVVPLVFGIIGLLIGAIFTGTVVGASKTPTPKAAPVAVKTVQAAAKTTTVVPKECIQALDEADRGFKLAADATSEFGDIITAIQNQDVEDIQDGTQNIKSINSSIQNLTPDYTADKLVCRAAASN
jgi:hypothetical protein